MNRVTDLYPSNNPDYVLEQALGEYESVLLLGYDEEGNLSMRSSTNLNRGDLLWIVEIFKRDILLNIEPEDEE